MTVQEPASAGAEPGAEPASLTAVDPAAAHLGPAALDSQLAACGLAAAVAVQPLVFNPNNPVTGTVERVTLDDGTHVVRKVICRDRPTTVAHWPAGQSAGHWNHWRREPHAYDSGLTAVFDGVGLPGPRLRGRCSPTEGVEVLFLAAVEGRSGADLDVADLARVAERLGRAQARSTDELVGLDALTDAPPWWSRDWMWRHATSRPPGRVVHDDAEAWEHPVVVEGFGDARHRLRVRFGELLDEVPRWQALMAQVPATVSHLDCWANNIIVPEPEAAPVAVLLDWSFVGVGAVGEDVGNLVPDGFLDHYMDPVTYGAVDTAVWSAFAGGLVAGGWPHDIRLARIAMCAAAMKFVWVPGLMVHNVEHSGPTGYGGRDGLDPVEVFQRRAVVFDAMLDRLDEADRLAKELGLTW